MKQNKVEEVQILLAEKGIKVAESAIIEVIMELTLTSPIWFNEVKEKFEQIGIERDYQRYQNAKELGLRDNI